MPQSSGSGSNVQDLSRAGAPQVILCFDRKKEKTESFRSSKGKPEDKREHYPFSLSLSRLQLPVACGGRTKKVTVCLPELFDEIRE